MLIKKPGKAPGSDIPASEITPYEVGNYRPVAHAAFADVATVRFEVTSGEKRVKYGFSTLGSRDVPRRPCGLPHRSTF